MSDSLILIPTYNEYENITRIIKAIFDLEKKFDILVIDDSSPDNTALLVKELQAQHPDSLFLLERKSKKGLGTAYIEGFKWGLSKSYQYIFEMDADFSHNPKDLIHLYNTCLSNEADVAIGSRYVNKGNVRNWSFERILLSKGASYYVKLLTRLPVNDPTAGFICYKASVLKNIDFSKISFSGYAFQIEMKYAAWKLGFSLKEIPITFVDRKLGQSKMSINIFNEALNGVWKMRKKSKRDYLLS